MGTTPMMNTPMMTPSHAMATPAQQHPMTTPSYQPTPRQTPAWPGATPRQTPRGMETPSHPSRQPHTPHTPHTPHPGLTPRAGPSSAGMDWAKAAEMWAKRSAPPRTPREGRSPRVQPSPRRTPQTPQVEGDSTPLFDER